MWGNEKSLWRILSLLWRHNEHNSVSNYRRIDCLLNRLFRRISKKTSRLRVTGLCEGNSTANGEFSAQRASNAENVSIWLCHHGSGCVGASRPQHHYTSRFYSFIFIGYYGTSNQTQQAHIKAVEAEWWVDALIANMSFEESSFIM